MLGGTLTAQVYYPGGMGNANLSLWLDAADNSTITLIYNTTGTTGSGTSGSATFTSAADISAVTPVGSQLRLGSATATTTYTITAISTTTITVTPSLSQTYSSSTIFIADVSQWNDKSGGARHATQATAASQPGYLKNVQNGLSVLNFPTNAANMTGASGTFQTVAAVRIVQSGANYHTLFSVPANSDNSSIRSYGPSGNKYGDGSPFNGQDWAGNALPNPACWVNGANTVNYNFGQYHLLTTYAVNTKTSNYSISSTFMSRGMNANDAVGEMVTTSNQLSVTNRQLLEGYLGWKWGNTLVAGPYINAGVTGFKNNLLGIGRVSTSDSVAATLSSNGLGFSVATSYLQDDGDYLTALDNNGVGAVSIINGISRVGRVWYITKTDVNNNGGNLTLYFDYNMLTGAAPGATLNNYQLIYHASDPTIPATGRTAIASAATAVAGNQVRFTVNASALANGYYTLASCNASAVFSYAASPYCSNYGTAAVTLANGSTAGSFTASPSGLSINSTTGAVTTSSSTAGSYLVTNTVNGSGCTTQSSAGITITAAPAATISYTSTPYCGNLATATVTRTGTAGGTYSSTTGLTIDNGTGALTPSSSTAGAYIVTYTVAAAGGCAVFTTTANVTISAPSSATISYPGSPFCSTVGSSAVTRTGAAGGVYSSTAGLTIDAGTGAVTPSSSTAGTYTVTYTMTNGGCITTANTPVTVTTTPSATISYASTPYCSNLASATVTRTGTAGGSFTATTGLTIDGTSGTVTPSTSTAGTYTVTYTVAAAGGCAVYTTTTTITITAAPSATISYTGSPFCTSSAVVPVTRTGTAGGSYSSTTGLTINSSTGTITPSSSTAGTYTVTYTVAAAGGCGVYTKTTSLVIVAAPLANTTISYAGTSYCTKTGSATVTLTGTSGGKYSSTAGLVIDSTTGTVNLTASTTGTYLVTYTIPANGPCAGISTTAQIIVGTPFPYALRFDANDDYVSIANHLTSSSFTIEAWIKTSVNSNTGSYAFQGSTLVSSDVGGVANDYNFTLLNNKLAFDNANNSTTIGVTNLNDGLWHHVAVVTTGGNPGTVQLYVDGTQDGASGTASSAVLNANPLVGIGGLYYNTFNGFIDEVRIWNTARTAAQILANRSVNLVGNETGLADYLRFDEGTGTKATNSVAGQSPGTLVNMVTTAATSDSSASGWVTAGFKYAGTPYCGIAGTATITLASNHTAGNFTASPAGLSLNASTGAINTGASTAGTYTVTNTTAGYGGCSEISKSLITITSTPSSTIGYTGSPFCTSSTPVTVNRTGTAGGTYSSTTGLTIDVTTGSITPGTSTAGTYTVTYTIAATGGCAVYTTTANVTISAPLSATISYAGSPFCSTTGSSVVTRTGATGGVYSSTSGLTINAGTGAVTPSSSTAGTYTVTYTLTNGSCVTTATTPVTINTTPSATISFASTPYCGNVVTASITRTGTAGGSYTSTSGLTIDSTSGTVTPTSSTAGTYTVTYTVAAAGGCAVYTTTTTITITAAPAASISYAGSPYCSSSGTASVTQTGTAGGTYSSTSGLVINAANGNVTLSSSTAQTYTVTYTVAGAGGCALFSTTASITITTQPVSTGSYTSTPYCSNAGSASASGAFSGAFGSFSATPAGLSLNTGNSVVNLGASTPGSYTVTYTVPAGGGCATYTQSAPITIVAAPQASTTISYAGSTNCAQTGSTPVTLTGTSGGRFTSTAGLSVDSVTGTVNLGASTAGSYLVTYTIKANGPCAGINTTAQILVGRPSPYALRFDGTNDYVSIANHLSKNSFTIEAWIKTSAASKTGTAASQGNALAWSDISGTANDYVFSILNNKLAFDDQSVNTTIGTINLNDGVWHHVAVVRTGGSPGTVQLYVDGVQDGATGTAGAAVLTANPVVGIGGYSGGSSFNGYMDEIRIWDTVRTAAQLQANRSVNLNNNVTWLTDYLRFDDGKGFTATNSVDGHSSGTLTNMDTTAATGNTSASGWVTAGFSYAGTPYCSSAGTATVTLASNQAAGNFTASPAGLSLNAATGAVNLSTSTMGTYTVTNTLSGNGACSEIYTTTISISSSSAATIAYAGSPYCTSAGTDSVTFTGTRGGTFSSTAGLVLDSVSGRLNLYASTAGTYTVTYAIAASGGCVALNQTTSVVIKASPAISQLPATNLIANFKMEGNATDATGNDNGTLQGAPSTTIDRFGVGGRAYAFNGSTDYIFTAKKYTSPSAFTVSIWFRSTTLTGGKLIGFGDAQTGQSGAFDRHIYMGVDGKIYFGLYNGSTVVVASPLSYNDGKWHLATATLSLTAGMVFYVDGFSVGTNSNTQAQTYDGYWRIGFDNTHGGWPNQPTTFYFNGSLDDAIIYQRALSAAEAAILYTSPDGAGNNGPVCSGSTITLSATTVAGATYSWTGGNGFSSTVQNPVVTYSAANAGVDTLRVSAGGCTSTAYTNLVSTSNAGQWTGTVSTDWNTAGNWCSGAVPSLSSNVLISRGAPNMPVIGAGASCNNLVIDSTATLTTTAAGTLNIAGNLTNSGTMTNNGTTNFTGTTGQQTFSGVLQFFNLTQTNSAGLLLPASVTVNNNLTLAAGTLTTANFNISIKGNLVNNASAAALNSGTGVVSFSGKAAQSIGGSSGTSFNNLAIADTANTVTLLVNAAVGGDLTVSYGIFDLGIYSANRAASGGNLTVSNGATLKIGGDSTFPKNYTTVNLDAASTVEYSGVTQTVSAQPYGNLSFSSSSGAAVKTSPATALVIKGNLILAKGAGTSVVFNAASAITVTGSVNIGVSTTFTGGSYTHSISGNWLNNGVFTGNTSTVSFTGSGSIVDGTGAQNFNNLTIAAANVSFINSSVNLSGNLLTSGTGSFVQSSGTLIMTGTGKTISGTGISLNNLTVSGTVSTAENLILTGNLAVINSFASTAGIITMSGASKTISGAGVISFSGLTVSGAVTAAIGFSVSGSLNINGSFTATAGTATFTGTSSFSGTGNLYNVTINGTSLQLSANATLGIANVLTITAGVLNVTSSVPNTVNFNGTGAQNINGITYDKLIFSNGNTKTASSAITANNDLTIGTGTTFVAGSFTHSCYGNWFNNGTFSAGTGTITFAGNTTETLAGATAFNNLTINGNSPEPSLLLSSSISAVTVNMTKGTIFMLNDTLTITGTRTGPGYIYGTISRTHTFSSGIAYAFESPFNTITFASVTGVNTVIVYVKEGTIADFPFNGSVNRVYNVSVPAGTYNATLRLHYEADQLNGNNESTMALWNYNGTTWIAKGKSANNTTDDWVELSGLTNITNRWTFSDNSNVVQWNGSVSTDWNTAANWTVQQGSASRPPGPNDVVNLGNIAFTFPPTISTAVTVKSIVFGSAQSLALSMAAGGSLVSGNINGNWASGAATHTINANNQTITVNGDLVLSDSTAGHVINLNIGTGTVNVNLALTQSGGAAITFSGAGILNLSNQFNYTSGIFTAGSGTVVYNGTENQTVGTVVYNNLTVNKATGIAIITSPVLISGNMVILAGELDNHSQTTLVGNATISSGATLMNFDTLHIGGNWTNNGSSIPSGGTADFNGTGKQFISATTFNNVTINKASDTAVLTGNIQLNGNLLVSAGTYDNKQFGTFRLVRGGSISVSNGATIIIGSPLGTSGNSSIDPNFSSYNYGISSTEVFNGVDSQALNLPGISVGNLILTNTGVKTLGSSLSVKGNFIVANGTIVNATSSTLSLDGNWVNNGTFNPGTGTVLLSGISKTLSGTATFNKATFSGSYSTAATTTINDSLNITTSGSISSGAGVLTIINGDLISRGTLNIGGTVTFTGLKLQNISLLNATTFVNTINFNGSVSPVLNSTSPAQFGYLNVNNTGGFNSSVGFTVLYTLTVGAGAILNAGIFTHNMYGDVTNNGTFTSSGTLNFIPSVGATLNLGTNFASTGNVVFGGNGAITLAGTPSSFKNLLISNKNGTGITATYNSNITGNLTIDTGSVFNAASYSNFIGGNIVINGELLRGTSLFSLVGSGVQDILSTSAFNNLTINKPSGFATLSSSISIKGVLNFTAGNIKTGSNTVQLGAAATLTGAGQGTGWVNGNLLKNIITGAATQSFEIGDSTRYTPVTIAFTNVSTAGNLAFHSTSTDQPNLSSSTINPNHSVNRYWTGSNSGVVFSNYTGTYNFVAADIDAGSATAAFKTSLYNGSSWTVPVTAAPNPTNIQATGVTTFGDMAVGEVCNAGTGISYGVNPYCSTAGTATPTITGTTGGVFSAAGGLSINVSTGVIDLGASTAGTYTVSYSISPASGCQGYLTTASITITAFPSATLAYTGSPYCAGAGQALVTRTGTAGGRYSSTAGLFITDTSGTIDLSQSVAGTYTVKYTVAAAAGCSLHTDSTTITIRLTGTWTGAISIDWTNAGNWLCSTLPVAATNVIIPGGLTNYPVINTGTVVINDLTIQTSAALTLTAATLTIGGNLVNTGTFLTGNGTVQMNGSGAQTIAAGAFTGNTISNLTINNTFGVTLGGPLKLTGILNLAAGSLTTGGYLTFVSTATGTASLAQVTSNAATPVIGAVTVQRYAVGRRKYRLITSSVTTSTASTLSAGQEGLSIWGNWQNSGNNSTPNAGNFITGGSTSDGFDAQTSTPSLFTYNHITRFFQGFTTANGKNTKYTPLKAGVPFYMFVYGDRLNNIYTPTPDNTVLSATGTLLTGDQVYNTGSVIPLYDTGFALIGNPFISPVNWATVVKTNVADTYWGWDPNLNSTGGYITVNTAGTITLIAPFSGTTGLNQYIQSGQAFFVRATAPAPVLTIREQDKVVNYNSNAFRTNSSSDANSIPLIAVNLLYNTGSTAILADGALAAFDPSFSLATGNEDALKLVGSFEGVSFSNLDKLLSIDARPMPQDKDTLLVNVALLKKQAYLLQVFTHDMQGRNLIPSLEDNYLHTSQLISLTDTTLVAFSVSADSASYGANRFRIVFNRQGVLPLAFVHVSAVKTGGQIQVNWQVSDQSGISTYTLERSGDDLKFTAQGELVSIMTNSDYGWLDKSILTGNNYYRIKAVKTDGSFVYSSVVLVVSDNPVPAIKVFPNPVLNHYFHMELINLARGRYNLLLYNAQGRQVISSFIDHPGGTAGQDIPFGRLLVPGTYYLQVFNSKERFMMEVVIGY